MARSVDGERLLVGEAKWTTDRRSLRAPSRPPSAHLPGAPEAEVVHARFTPQPVGSPARDLHQIGADTVLAALR